MANCDPQTIGLADQTVSAAVIQKFRQKADVYVGRRDQTCIEIGSFDDKNQSYCDEVKVPIPDLRSWLDPKSSFHVVSGRKQPPRTLRLLICPMNLDMNSYLPIPKETLQSVLCLLNLEDSYMYDEQLQAPPSWFSIPLENNMTGLIIKPEKWDSEYANFSLIMVHDPKSGRTCGILHLLLKLELEQLKCRLDTLRHIDWNPMLLPLIMLEIRTNGIAKDLARIRTAVYETEKRIGTHKNYQRSSKHTEWGYYAHGEEVWKREEFDSSAGDLTSLASDCVLFESKCEINLRLLNWIEEIQKTFSPTVVDSNTGLKTHPTTGLSEKIRFMRTGLENNLIRSVYLGKRAQVQVQACLSIMSQRDNALNFQTSLAAAATSKAAARDSTDMRTIAAVTLIFLPGTFAATLFSTGFFNFQKENRVVSGWIWLYWVVTVGLTVLVLGGWIFWSRFSQRLARRLSIDSASQPEEKD